eukprot:7891639-Pyramimonas_sp.AAC.1
MEQEFLEIYQIDGNDSNPYIGRARELRVQRRRPPPPRQLPFPRTSNAAVWFRALSQVLQELSHCQKLCERVSTLSACRRLRHSAGSLPLALVGPWLGLLYVAADVDWGLASFLAHEARDLAAHHQRIGEKRRDQEWRDW